MPLSFLLIRQNPKFSKFSRFFLSKTFFPGFPWFPWAVGTLPYLQIIANRENSWVIQLLHEIGWWVQTVYSENCKVLGFPLAGGMEGEAHPHVITLPLYSSPPLPNSSCMFSTPVGNAKYSWAKLDNEWLWTVSGFSLFKQANSKWNNKFATFKWWSNYFQFCSAKNVKHLSECTLCRF